jgi:hypothetical protein
MRYLGSKLNSSELYEDENADTTNNATISEMLIKG